MTVTGANSLWQLAHDLYVGGSSTSAGGAGLLKVGNGGTVNVGGTLKLWDQGNLVVETGGTLTAQQLALSLGTFTFSTGSHVTGQTGSTLTVTSGNVQSGADINFDVHVGNDGGFTNLGTVTANVSVNGANAQFVNSNTVTGNVDVGGTNALFVNNGLVTGDIATSSGGTLGGSGVVAGNLSGAGTVAPGNSPGVLDAVQVDPTAGTNFLFQFTAANTIPDYLSRISSINDVLHLTDPTTPFLAALGANNTITVDFQVAALQPGDTFVGGFFTNRPGNDFYGDGTVSGAVYNYLLNGSALDTSLWHVNVATISQTNVDFGAGYGGVTDGRVMQFTLTPVAVPEPSSIILAGLGGAAWYARRRKKQHATGEPSTASPNAG